MGALSTTRLCASPAVHLTDVLINLQHAVTASDAVANPGVDMQLVAIADLSRWDSETALKTHEQQSAVWGAVHAHLSAPMLVQESDQGWLVLMIGHLLQLPPGSALGRRSRALRLWMPQLGCMS